MAKHVGIAPSLERSTDFSSPLIVSSDSDGTDALHLVVDITAGTGNLLVAVKGVDKTSGKAYTILQSGPLNAVGTTVMRVGPEYTAAANVAKDYIPYAWRVDVTASGGVPVTYSIGASWI